MPLTTPLFPPTATSPPTAMSSPPTALRVTALPSGLRVVSLDLYTSLPLLALFADAGSSRETGDAQVGISGVLQPLLTTPHCTSTAARDAFSLQVGGATSTSTAVDTLATVLLSSTWSELELQRAHNACVYAQSESVASPAVQVGQALSAAAYGPTSTYGRPELRVRHAPPTLAQVVKFMGDNFKSESTVIAAVGVQHEELVERVAHAFQRLERGSNGPRPTSTYVGGEVRLEHEYSGGASVARGAARDDLNLTHMSVGLHVSGWSHDDVVPVAVVDTLLGGGSSFSAGGPGKGMYSRLYREVLNSASWVEACSAFSTQLYDSGLLGIYGAAPPAYAGTLMNMMCSHLKRVAETPVKPHELARARNQLASSIMMNLETRALLVEDIGRQVLSHGKRLDPVELLARIQAVTQDDLMRVVRKALAEPPSLSVVGDASTMPNYDQLCNMLRL